MKRDIDDTCEKLCRFQIRETIDLTIDELGETIDLTIDEFEDDNDFTEFTPRVDQLTYPYNLLPSSDEEEPVIVSYMLQHNIVHFDTYRPKLVKYPVGTRQLFTIKFIQFLLSA